MGTMHIDPLSDALFGKAQSALLGLFFAQPDEAFYLRQIISRTGLGVGHVQRELTRLAAGGIVRRSLVGRHVFFQAAPDCPIYQELRSIVAKTIGAAGVLREALAPIEGQIRVAFIFGSVARGQERKASDLDLMVIGDVSLQEITRRLRDAESHLQREINPMIYPPAELADKLFRKHHFLSSVMKGKKLFVLGDERELGRLSKKRLDPDP